MHVLVSGTVQARYDVAYLPCMNVPRSAAKHADRVRSQARWFTIKILFPRSRSNPRVRSNAYRVISLSNPPWGGGGGGGGGAGRGVCRVAVTIVKEIIKCEGTDNMLKTCSSYVIIAWLYK